MKKIGIKLFVILMVLLLALPYVAAADTTTKKTEVNDTISIVFSHDMHSHLEKFSKLATVIKQEKKANPNTFVLDAGDFSMGTPYQSIYKEEAAELRMMGFVGYDVTTFGNHEFDFRSNGLSEMLNTAVASGDKLPQIVASNINFTETLKDKTLAPNAKKLMSAMNNYGASQDYIVVEKDGAKIAVFGLFGKDADSCAPESGTIFSDSIERATEVVADIKKNEKVDMIVCLSHCGTSDNKEDSEDENLAKGVDGIDLIISGHTHTQLDEPIVVNNTIIASVGQYNNNIGKVTFKKVDGKYQLDTYNLVKLDKKITGNTKTFEKVAEFRKLVNQEYFSKFGLSWGQVLAKNNISFTDIDSLGDVQGEDTLGNLIADSYKYGIKEAEGKDYEKVDVSIAPVGVIRGSFGIGNITVGDAFNALSLGTGKDGVAGYPLVSVYLTGEEIKLIAEVDISVSELMSAARLYISGITYTYNPHRLMLNRVSQVELMDDKGKTSEIEDDKLYRVVGDLYSCQMLGAVNGQSYGLLSVTPKNKDGSVIKDFEKNIIYMKNGAELKEWYALATYIDSFQGNKVLDTYSEIQGRKVLDNSFNPVSLFKNPNKIFWMALALLAILIAVIGLIIILIVKIVRRIKYGKRGRPIKNRMKRKDKMFSRHSSRYR